MKGRRSALLAGASGLVGGELLRRLVAMPAYDRIVVLARRDLGAVVKSQRVHQVIADFDALERLRDEFAVDHVFCALGTTIAKAGSQDAFRRVDLEYPLRIAEAARAAGATHYSLVSALGASATSPFFYSRVKGELERRLREMDWPSLCLVRPSVIAGERAESRPLERLAGRALAFAPKRWRPVPAADIAATMIRTALASPAGVTVIESASIVPDR